MCMILYNVAVIKGKKHIDIINGFVIKIILHCTGYSILVLLSLMQRCWYAISIPISSLRPNIPVSQHIFLSQW